MAQEYTKFPKYNVKHGPMSGFDLIPNENGMFHADIQGKKISLFPTSQIDDISMSQIYGPMFEGKIDINNVTPAKVEASGMRDMWEVVEKGHSKTVAPKIETPKAETPRVVGRTPKEDIQIEKLRGYGYTEEKLQQIMDTSEKRAKAKISEVEPPKVEAPKVEAPKVETPKVEAAKVVPPVVETPKVEVPKVVPPKVETPKVEAAKVIPPEVEIPKVQQPKPVEPSPKVMEHIAPEVVTKTKVEEKAIPTKPTPTKVETPKEIKTPSLKEALGSSEVSNIVKNVEQDAEKMANKAMKFHKGAMKGIGIVGGIVAAGTIGSVLLDAQRKGNVKKMRNAAEKSGKKKAEAARNPSGKAEAYYDMMQFNDFIKNLYDGRSNSSNSYGGKRY